MIGNLNPEQAYETRKLIGSWLKQLREDKQMSQQELGKIMGIDQTTIAKIENGKWNFGIDTITLFAIHLDFYLFMLPKDSNDSLADMMRNRWGELHKN